MRETFHCSLTLTELVLEALGKQPADAHRAVELFHVHDEAQLIQTFDFYQDQRQLIQNAQKSAAELASLFELDKPITVAPRPAE